MNLEYEDLVPVQFSPVMSPASPVSPIMSPPSPVSPIMSPISEDDNTWDTLNYESTFRSNFSQEYLEPSLPDNLLQKMHHSEYFENFSETKSNVYQSYNINGIKLNHKEDFETDSENSYAALDKQSLHGLTTEDEEEPSTPPRKKLKTQDVPVMYTNIVASNFIYHSTKYISLPVSLPKIPNLPFHSLPNVRLTTEKHFLTNFSQMKDVISSSYHVCHTNGMFFGLGVTLFLETTYYSGPIFSFFLSTVYISIDNLPFIIIAVTVSVLISELKKLRISKEGSGNQDHKARPRVICPLLIGLVNTALCL